MSEGRRSPRTLFPRLRTLASLLGMASALALMSPTALAQDPATETVQYKVDAANTTVYALVYKAGAASAVAHDHVVKADEISGSVKWNKKTPTQSSVSLTVQVAKFMPDDDAMRKKVGLPDTLSAKQRGEILRHILADYQLDSDTFSTMTFASTGVVGAGTTFKVTGNFTLRGVTKQVTVPMIVFPKDGGLIAGGKFRILQSDYGYKPYSALFGALKVKDQVDIVMNIKLVPN